MAEAARERSWLLAIDSSTEQAGLALFDGRQVAELSWLAGRTQTTSLLVEIHHLLDLCAIEAGDLGAVAVATGPGTFTGLRVGVSVGKGFALALDLAIVGVPTLSIAALPFVQPGATVIPVVAAGRGRLVWSTMTAGDDGPIETVPPRNGTIEELVVQLASTPAGTIVTGELTAEQEVAVRAVPAVRLPPTPVRRRSPAALAYLGWSRWRAGHADDLEMLEPIYLGVGNR